MVPVQPAIGHNQVTVQCSCPGVAPVSEAPTLQTSWPPTVTGPRCALVIWGMSQRGCELMVASFLQGQMESQSLK